MQIYPHIAGLQSYLHDCDIKRKVYRFDGDWNVYIRVRVRAVDLSTYHCEEMRTLQESLETLQCVCHNDSMTESGFNIDDDLKEVSEIDDNKKK